MENEKALSPTTVAGQRGIRVVKEDWSPELRKLVNLWEAYNELARELGRGCAEIAIEAFVEDFNALDREGYDMKELCRGEDCCRVCPTCMAEGICFMTFKSLMSMIGDMCDELDHRDARRDLEYDDDDDDGLEPTVRNQWQFH